MVYRYFLLLLTLSLSPLAYADLLVDPTRPAGYQPPVTDKIDTSVPIRTAAVKKWILNTTLVSPYQRLAMINGKRVEIGEEINGAELVSIDHQKVQLRYQGKLMTVKLYNSFISNMKPSNR